LESSSTKPELIRALAEAFGQEASTPAERTLGGGVKATAYWSFAPSLEIVVGEANRLPSDGQALAAWRARLGRRPIPLVLLIDADGGSLVVGPSGNPPPVVSVDPRLVVPLGQGETGEAHARRRPRRARQHSPNGRKSVLRTSLTTLKTPPYH
jgi:hypothetical protein